MPTIVGPLVVIALPHRRSGVGRVRPVVCAMKGKSIFFPLGLLSGIFWIIGASGLAKPNSQGMVRASVSGERGSGSWSTSSGDA